MPSLDEAEYRFEEITDKQEQQDCFDWELWREFFRQEGRNPPKPWRKLTPQQKKNSRKACFVDTFDRTIGDPITIVPNAPLRLGGAVVEKVDGDGNKVRNLESFSIPEITIDWGKTDTWDCFDKTDRESGSFS